MNGKKVLVGMSGGVDSSVAALLLQQRGYQVAGATFRLWDGGEAAPGCAAEDIGDARQVCDTLGIPHYVFDYSGLFREKVVDYFAGEYRRGATPNPCIVCNRHIKFGAFWQQAQEMGFDYIATGHYANVEEDSEAGRCHLRRGDHAPKDQSYVLYTLTQQQLAHILMPLGPYQKAQVRELAQDHRLVVEKKAESQDICFVPDGDYASFLERYTGIQAPEGDFIDSQGNVLGRHRGTWRYTIGQRKGLGMGFGKPMYVVGIDSGRGTVTLADNEALMAAELIMEDINYIEFDRLEAPADFSVKIRYGAQPAPAKVYPLDRGRARVEFRQPQRAVTPGQAAVLYDGDYVVGGGTILG